jgi:hypothetical protein
VWIDGGLHATEAIAGQNIIELVWQMTSRDDAEVRRILDEVVLLVCPVNPDGLELIANAYRATRSTTTPVLYQRYIGHDNNRDFYICNQLEAQNINRVFYTDWCPQIVYNHHQTAPRGRSSSRRRSAIRRTTTRTDGDARHRARQRAHERAFRRRGQTRRDQQERRAILGLVERRPALDQLLPQRDRHPDRVVRPARADSDRTAARSPRALRRLPRPGAGAAVARAPDGRVSADRELRDPRLRRALPQRSAAGIWTMASRSIDRGRRDWWTPTPVLVEAARRRDDPTRCSPIRICAIRAPTCCAATRGTGARRRGWLRALQRCGVEVHRAKEPFAMNGVVCRPGRSS